MLPIWRQLQPDAACCVTPALNFLEYKQTDSNMEAAAGVDSYSGGAQVAERCLVAATGSPSVCFNETLQDDNITSSQHVC